MTGKAKVNGKCACPVKRGCAYSTNALLKRVRLLEVELNAQVSLQVMTFDA